MTNIRTYIPLLLAAALMLVALATYGVVSSQSGNGKYDSDGDGLIEIQYLEQLDAMRYDLNGDGKADADSQDGYYAAFPTENGERICNRNCKGYELARSLDFDDADSYAEGKVNTQWTTRSGWLPVGLKEKQVQHYL